MEMTARLKILGLILVVWTEAALAQSVCSITQQLIATPPSNISVAETITSPNYPQHYDDKTECSWLIQTYHYTGYIVKVVFNEFTLEDAFISGCRKTDSLSFYDGFSSMSTHIGSFCGTSHPDVIYSSGRSLYIKFHSDSGITQKGFNLSFSAVKEEEASGICRPGIFTTDIFSNSQRAFFSPNYPAPYPNNADCTWRITVPVGKRVKLTFESFRLQSTFVDVSSCHSGKDDYDFVEVRDGQTSMNFEIGLFCYHNMLYGRIPPVLYSAGRYMWVRFRSDDVQLYSNKYSKKGFKAHFEAVDQPDDINFLKECYIGNMNNYNLRLTGNRGTLKSPLDLYPPNLNCSWLITVPEGKIVQLTFNKFDLYSFDYVEVLDGQFASSKQEGRFYGSTRSTVGPFHSSTRYMKVNFLAGSYDLHRYKGFEATFKAVEKNSIGGSTMALGLGVSVGILILIMIIVCVFCNAKRAKAQRRANDDGAGMSMMTASTSASHTAQPPPPSQAPHQPANHPNPTPRVGYVPVTTNPSLLPPAYPYPDSPPPPYPGTEEVPQYPPPGQSYPWLQNNTPVQPSAPPISP